LGQAKRVCFSRTHARRHGSACGWGSQLARGIRGVAVADAEAAAAEERGANVARRVVVSWDAYAAVKIS